MSVITSAENKTYKTLKKLMVKKHRDAMGLFLVYGTHLVDKAKEAGVVTDVVTGPEGGGTIRLDEALFLSLQQTVTPYDVIAVCRKTAHRHKTSRVLVLDDVQDPDNVGALIRSAAAFGFLHVILGKSCADLHNEKTIRASKGAIFDVSVERTDIIRAIKALKDEHFTVVAADSGGQEPGHFDTPVALVMGNEGHGIKEGVLELADGIAGIPTRRVESLNVAVAGGILMHAWRER
jgi:TrmH family RNA methyltransferase